MLYSREQVIFFSFISYSLLLGLIIIFGKNCNLALTGSDESGVSGVNVGRCGAACDPSPN